VTVTIVPILPNSRFDLYRPSQPICPEAQTPREFLLSPYIRNL
jgi:hypothetical protein